MTPERDIERLLDVWLAEGPQQVADSVFDDAVARLPRTRQRRVWHLAWRDSTVTMPMRLAAAAVAAIAVIALAAQFLPRNDIGVPSPSPSTTPTVAPSPTDTPGPSPGRYCPNLGPECTGTSPAGHYTTQQFLVPFGFDLPDGWAKPLDVPGAINMHMPGPPDDLLGVWPDWKIANQSTCSEVPEPGLGRTVDDLVSFVVGHPGLIATTPEAVTLGGLSGQVLEVEVDSSVPMVCPTEFNLFTHRGTIDDGGWWTLYPDEHSRMYFLDAGGDRTVHVEIRALKADFTTYLRSAQTIVDTFDFTP